MKRFVNLPAMVLGILVAGCAAGWYFTRDTRDHPTAMTRATDETLLADQRLIETAQSIATLAETPAERDLAREALRLTDHELDQAFATALREATGAPPPASGPLLELNARIAKIKTRMAADQDRIVQLTRSAAASDTAAGQLELAKAQLALDQDELDDAQEDLARSGGDRHTRLQQALQAHEAAQHQQAQPVRYSEPAPTGTLSQQLRAWFGLGSSDRQLLAAERQVASQAVALARAHHELEQSVGGKSESSSSAQPGGDQSDADETAAMVARLQHLSNQRKTLAELDRRVQDCQQLANVYRGWSGLVEIQRRAVLHLLSWSMAALFAVLLIAVLVSHVARQAIGKQTDRRRAHQLRAMVRLAVFVLAAFAILLLLFGPPTQLATVLGLATAGLTVVLKDFIVAFIGWFSLMGKNGIRVGDFVEINGVGGEVVDIGILRTVLLEMGNWTVKGHPTGRRVTFVNSFAIEGQYFNFSTSGQWLWDELTVTLPAGANPYRMSQQIRELVDRETEAEAAEAEQEWQRVTHEYGMRSFSAKPASEIRPSPLGLEVLVRYITRAPQRHQVKSRLFERIVELMHTSEGRGLGAAGRGGD